MKIEKVNENQIRCTLTREDLASREIKISELAYGTEKAKNLFRDMMQQASYEFGFEAEDIPLMIEAIPLNADCIVLIITKVEDPEELDTRFSRFAPSIMEDEGDFEDGSADEKNEVLELFHKLKDAADSDKKIAQPEEDQNAIKVEKAPAPVFKSRILVSDSLNQIMSAATVVNSYFDGSSALYKDNEKDLYILYLLQGENSENFDRVCNTLSEYGNVQMVGKKNLSFFEEHCDKLIAENAVERLGGAE